MKRMVSGSFALLLLGLALFAQNEGYAQALWWATSQLERSSGMAEFAVLALSTGPVGAVAVDPHNPSSIYLGGSEGLYHSNDAGESWALLSRDLPYPHILMLDPHDPNQLYAARRDMATFLPLPGVYRSTDGGSNWRRLGDGLGEDPVFALALDPLHQGILYAGSWAGRVYKTVDGGAHWAAVSSRPVRVCPRCAPSTIGQLMVSPVDGALYALADNSGTFRSTDGGARWTLIQGDSGWLALDPQRGDLYLAGRRLQRSNNSGETWEDLSEGLPYDPRSGTYASFWVAVNSDPLVLYTRFHRSVDGGVTWDPLETPMTFVPRLLLPGTRPAIYGSINGHAGRYQEEALDVP